MQTETKTFVNSFTSRGGTSAKQRKARDWERRSEMRCPFCSVRTTRGSWMQHIVAKHALQGAALVPWLTAFNFGEVEQARNCTNGAVRRAEAA